MPHRERQVLQVITSLWNLKKKKKKTARGWGMECIGRGQSKGTNFQL